MYCPFRPLLFLVGTFVLITVCPAQAANLITNGSFETPTLSSPSQFLDIAAGAQPSGFTWDVTSDSVDVVTAGTLFASTAFDGAQFLDLDGFAPGAISQSFSTVVGTGYIVSFAYANNPQGPGGLPSPGCAVGGPCATIPATATAYVLDSGTDTQLIAPLLLTHGSSTVANPDWTSSGAIMFIAKGTTTSLSFVSDDPSSSDGGIFLDAVLVETSAVPEPRFTGPRVGVDLMFSSHRQGL